MKIIIGQNTYTDIRNLKLDVEVDITNNNLPINELYVDIKTNSQINVGDYCILKDDSDEVWAKYVITDYKQIEAQWHQIQAKSLLVLLDRVTLPAVKLTGTGVVALLDHLFDKVETVAQTLLHYISPMFSGETLNGYLPEQTARERLQWICFTIGAYVKTMFNEVIEVLPIDDETAVIPENKVFWRPEYSYSEYVTAIKIKSYSFTQGTPSTTDQWVEAGGNTYIVTETEHTLTNVNAPSGTQDNIISVPNIMIVDADNYSSILSRLAGYWFNRVQVVADLINNGEYLAGERVSLPTLDNVITGYIKSEVFEYGKQARSKVILRTSVESESSLLTINYKYSDRVLDTKQYRFIVGYNYSINTKWIDIVETDGTRNIFKPNDDTITGVKASTDETINEQCIIGIQDANTVISTYAVDDAFAVQGVVRIV